MDRLILLLRDTSDSNIGSADSFSDRLNNKYTVSILVIFALLTTTRQYVSEPISCWCPNYFTKDQVDYVNKVCWTTSTYFLEDTVTEIPGENEPIDKVSYYQWIPLVAVGQAFMFIVPKIIWTMFSRKAGISVDTITDAAMERQKKSEQASADKTMEFMVKTLGKFLKELSWDRSCVKGLGTKSPIRQKLYVVFYGNYLTCLYVVIKIIYIVNVILQIVLLNAFLQTNYSMYGFETMSRMVRGEDWTTSHRFPRIAMCNFIIRAMGENMHRYSVQCSIPINLIHEIFYIFLWFWFVFILLLTSASCLFWCYNCFPESHRLVYVREKLYADGQLRRKPDEETERRFKDFVVKYLKRDGCFIARLVAKNTSDVVAADLFAGLWKDYVLKTIKYEAERQFLGDCSPDANSLTKKAPLIQRVMSEPEHA